MSQSDFVTRGQALISSGQYQEAVKVCRLGLLGRPTTVEGRVVLGQALLALKRYDEVLAEMRVALELDHASHGAQALKGEALLRKGDGHGAVEVFGQLRSQGLADSRVAALLAEAERLASRSPPGNANRPAIGLVAPDPAAFAADHGTKNYPAHQVDTAGAADAEFEDTGSEFTRPTSLAAPGARRRSHAEPPGPPSDATPSPAVLAVGDRSGTVEVDPELEGFELRANEDDFGDVVGPPIDANGADLDGDATGVLAGARGSVAAATRPSRSPAAGAAAKKSRRASMFKEEVSTVELGDAEVVELGAPRPAQGRGPGRKIVGGTAVRNAVKMPSGPLDQYPAASRPTALPLPAPARLIASQPQVMSTAPQPQPQISPRSAIAAALPTAAAMPMPSQPMAPMAMGQPPMAMGQPPMAMGQPPMAAMPMGQPMQLPQHLQQTMLAPPLAGQALQQLPPHLQSSLAAARPTIALDVQQPQSAAPVASLFNGQDQGWPRQAALPAGSPPYGSVRAGADEATRQPHAIDPRIAAIHGGQGPGGMPVMSGAGEPSSSAGKPARAGGRRARSRLILVWIMIGAAVISGGVLAGFQIRALRLRRQITAARDRAGDVARADTWQGWLGARDSLYGIAQASPTVDNKAALARARGVLAFEFGDGLSDARAAVDGLAGQSGLDLDLAAAYVALAQRDARAARDAAERALEDAANDPAALYVSGQAAVLAGDLKAAVASLRAAVERDPRPHYLVGLARALGDSGAWDDAITAVDRARDTPGAIIARAVLLAGASRLPVGPGGDIRPQLARLISDAQRDAQKPGDQALSPAQIAFADLALARVDFARGELGAARADYLASLNVGLDDQRFAEELSDTVLAIGELEAARKAATRTLEKWPASRRARITLARVWLALGRPATALELFTKASDATAGPIGQTVRGQARLATGDTDGARADFDAALKKLPGFEPAMIARAWLDLAAGDVDEARRRIEPRFDPRTASIAMVAVYAAILRTGGDPDALDKARKLLDRVVGGTRGPDTARAQLELARLDRDLGDLKAARTAYAEASRAGNPEARLESGLLLIDDADPRGGRDTLEQLLREAGDQPAPALLLETARARTLMGDHAGALALLARADKAPGVPRWQLDRERGRVALHRGDVAGAAQAVDRALDGCGGDLDSFLLAADTVSTDDRLAALTQKLRTLMPARLKGRPEINIIAGKLYLIGSQYEEAEKVYSAAREALVKDNASPRRRAQADFGLAAVAYFRRDDPTAVNMLELVNVEDPSIYSAYLFAAEIDRPRDPEKALDKAQKAVAFNPDSVEGWKMVGTIAAQLPRQRKLLDEAITRLRDLAPGSEALRQLQRLK